MIFNKKRNKRLDKSFRKNKSLIIINIKSFCKTLASKIILFFNKIGQKIDIRALLKTRS